MTPEDNIEQEIDLADQTKEKVCSAINNIDHTLNQAGQEVIPASDNLPSENPAHTMRGSTLFHSPHSCPEPTNPSTHSHTSDTQSHSESPTPTDTLLTDTPMVIAQPRVKLPKLTIKKFKGKLTKRVMFLDSFESAIHSNSTLVKCRQVQLPIFFLGFHTI